MLTRNIYCFQVIELKTKKIYCAKQRGRSSVQFSSVQSPDRLGRRENMRDDSAVILVQSFLQEALVSSFGTGRDVHSLMLSTQHFHCRPRCRPPSKVPWKMVWKVSILVHSRMYRNENLCCTNQNVSASTALPTLQGALKDGFRGFHFCTC